MKNQILLLASVLCFINATSQSEFTTYKNGLIYSDATMSKLRHVVDSLNLKYKTCEFDKKYFSKYQATAHKIILVAGNIVQGKKDMQNNISFADFIKKHPRAVIDSNVLVVKHRYTSYDDIDYVEYSEIDLGDKYSELEIKRENKNNLYEEKVEGRWVFEYQSKSKYSDESLEAFYFPTEFKSIEINHKYSRQIGYADCLIDTTTAKLKEELERGDSDLPENWAKLSIDEKKELLDKLRSTRVVGYCSQDGRPRQHALNIAVLSAETTNWEVFLKSHLDVMNDRFERRSDGSYAWGKRKTYLRELEELDIDVLSLMIGISLRFEDPAKHHYFGSIGRLGRAISDSQNRYDFQKAMLELIEDKSLDDYNRVIGFYLFSSYNNYLENEQEKKINRDLLKESVTKLPDYISKRISFESD